MTDSSSNTQPLSTPPAASSNAWMPTAGGVLSIVAGVLGVIGSFFLFFLAFVGAVATNRFLYPGFEGFPAALFGFFGFWCLVTGALALVGGIFALKRRNWGLALTGSIAALVGGSTLLGILAIVFVAMSKREFAS